MKSIIKPFLFTLASLALATWMLFNFFAGIVGGIWLAISGGISLVIYGLLAGFIMPYIYTITFIPVMLLLPILEKVIEGGHKITTAILGFIVSGYQNFIMSLWIVSVFEWFAYSSKLPGLALLLYGYSVALSPVGYMAQQEGPDAGLGTSLGYLFAQVLYLTLTINFILGGSKETGYAWIWLLMIGYTLLSSILVGIAVVPYKKLNNDKNINTNSNNPVDEKIAKNENYNEISPIDPKVIDALELYLDNYDRISASLLQRRLSIGFVRAARIFDALEKYGIVTPYTGEGDDLPQWLIMNDEDYKNKKALLESLPQLTTVQIKDEFPDDEPEPIEEKDEIYPDVINLLQEKGFMSIPLLQDKFKIGYARAARIMDLLEEDKFIVINRNDSTNMLQTESLSGLKLCPICKRKYALSKNKCNYCKSDLIGEHDVIDQPNSLFCSNCGKSVNTEAKFCKHCGIKL